MPDPSVAAGTPDPTVARENESPATGTPDPAVAAEQTPENPRGLEDVAWAGVAAAAEAATIGVRLANRALEAMRDAVDRR